MCKRLLNNHSNSYYELLDAECINAWNLLTHISEGKNKYDKPKQAKQIRLHAPKLHESWLHKFILSYVPSMSLEYSC